MENTWTTRDLPVLDAIVRHLEDRDEISASDLVPLTGLSIADVIRALRAMEGIYLTVSGEMGDSEAYWVDAITPAARQAVGQWPSADQWVTELVKALTDAADSEPNEERRSKLRTAALVITGIARDIVVQTAATKLGMRLPG